MVPVSIFYSVYLQTTNPIVDEKTLISLVLQEYPQLKLVEANCNGYTVLCLEGISLASDSPLWEQFRTELGRRDLSQLRGQE